MYWFLYDNSFRHERVKWKATVDFNKGDCVESFSNNFLNYVSSEDNIFYLTIKFYEEFCLVREIHAKKGWSPNFLSNIKRT